MNKSIQSLLAIFALVGGALASSLNGASQSFVARELDESVKPFVPSEEAKEECLAFVKNDLRTVGLPEDVAQMMDQFWELLIGEKDQKAAMEDLVRFGLQDQVMPTSCPTFVGRINQTEHDEHHCGWLEHHPDVGEEINEDIINDDNFSNLIFAAQACARLQYLEAVKERYQSWYEDLYNAYKEITVPEDVEQQMNMPDEMGDVHEVTMQDKESSCAKLAEKEQAIRSRLDRLKNQAEEKELFDEIVYLKLTEDAQILNTMESADECKRLQNDSDPESAKVYYDSLS